MTRRRADTLLAERGLAPSRTAAAASVRAGRVRIGADGPAVEKPGQMVAADSDLIVTEPPPYVSRGGVKLANALGATGVDPEGRRCLDVGASTGGFTDCLLKRGAAGVIALDVGHGQLDWGLRNDERVEVIERFNARALTPADLPYVPDLVTVDVSFISLAKVMAPVAGALAPGGEVLAMVKPQFELEPDRVGSGGVVRDAAERKRAVLGVAEAAADLGLATVGVASSGLPGPKGNRETFLHLADGGDAIGDLEAAIAGVDP